MSISLPLFLLLAAIHVNGQQIPDLDYRVASDNLSLPDGWLFGPTPGVAVNDSGHLFVFNRGQHPLLEFDSEGQFVREIGAGIFETAHGLRIDSDGNIWTTDAAKHMVVKFSPGGEVLMVLGIRGAPGEFIDTLGLVATLFNKPTDVAFDSRKNVYVADGYGNSRVVKFDSAGRFIKTWGKKGSEPGQFSTPHALVVDRDDRVLVCDRDNSRIQIFDTEGNLLDIWDQIGRPWGLVARPDGSLWMADGTANRILKLSRDGEILGSFGKEGRLPGQFKWLHWLEVTPDETIYTGEILNWRVQRFEIP